MEPQIYTDTHRFLKQIRNDFFVNLSVLNHLIYPVSSVFICVPLWLKILPFVLFSCLFVAKK